MNLYPPQGKAPHPVHLRLDKRVETSPDQMGHRIHLDALMRRPLQISTSPTFICLCQS